MKQQAQDDKHAKQMERQDHVIRQQQLEEEKKAKEELQARLARLEMEATAAQEGWSQSYVYCYLTPLSIHSQPWLRKRVSHNSLRRR